jgi:hypothetical protein
MAFLGSIESLHLFLQDFIDVGNVGALVRKLSCEGRELIFQDSDLTFERFLLFIRL